MSMALLKAQVFISSRLIRFSVIFKIISIHQDLATLAEMITNISAVFSNRMSGTVKIVIVFLQNYYCLYFFSLSAFFSLSICITLTLSWLPNSSRWYPPWDEDRHKYTYKSVHKEGNIIPWLLQLLASLDPQPSHKTAGFWEKKAVTLTAAVSLSQAPLNKLWVSPKEKRGVSVGGTGMANLKCSPLLCRGDRTQVLPSPPALPAPRSQHSFTHQECSQPTPKGACSAPGEGCNNQEHEAH